MTKKLKKIANFFSRNTRNSRPKNDEKNRLEKVRKHIFYKHTNIVTINRGEKREKFFLKNTRTEYPKYVGKKSSQKSAKKCFLINT